MSLICICLTRQVERLQTAENGDLSIYLQNYRWRLEIKTPVGMPAPNPNAKKPIFTAEDVSDQMTTDETVANKRNKTAMIMRELFDFILGSP